MRLRDRFVVVEGLRRGVGVALEEPRSCALMVHSEIVEDCGEDDGADCYCETAAHVKTCCGAFCMFVMRMERNSGCSMDDQD